MNMLATYYITALGYGYPFYSLSEARRAYWDFLERDRFEASKIRSSGVSASRAIFREVLTPSSDDPLVAYYSAHGRFSRKPR